MFYTCEGFQVEQLKKYGLTCQDAHILRWFSQYIHSGNMDKIVYRNETYYKLKYEYLLKELLLVRFRQKRQCQERFEYYCKKKIMERRVERDMKDATCRQSAYFRLLPRFYSLSAQTSEKKDVTEFSLQVVK